ncbi:MAG: aldehyde dehydrogenase family protein [Planctomycetes bacterium]|nr:aldehyde dehydrogenase family protein [Planctomycetota bacterium]
MSAARRKRSGAPERVPVAKTYKLYVGGAFVRSESGQTSRQTDPEGRFVANVSKASRKDFRDAVRAARAAQGGWARKSAFNRSQILFRIAETLEDRRSLFEHTLVEQGGFAAAEAAAEVSSAVDRVFWYAGWADKFTQVLGNVNPVASPFFNFSMPEPMGVVVLLPSLRSPLVGLVSAILPAIVSGNTVVALVDGELLTPALDLGEAIATSDVPGGVVNILTGRHAELLPHAAAHMDVDAVGLWSADVGMRTALQTAAADNVKRVRVHDDPERAAWRDPAAESLYRIDEFVEIKTAWHPIGT